MSEARGIFFTKKTVWKMKWWVKITLLGVILVSIISFAKTILSYSFDYLAPLKMDAFPYEVAVVEGWISDAQIVEAARLIMKKAIPKVVVTGSSLEFCAEFMPADNHAALGALRLLKSGIKRENILEVVNKDNNKYSTKIVVDQDLLPLEISF